MCGIFGYISSGKPLAEQHAMACLQAIAHRGPDGQGLWCDEAAGVWLGHRRLSIIDLDPRSAQPMHDPITGHVLVFNGEIYNYQELKAALLQQGHEFRTTSDTEVILKGYAQWGIDVLRKLKGMFAIALYDRSKQHVLLARDRMGEKPLFIYEDDGRFVFASELKAILPIPQVARQLDEAAFAHLLAYGYTSRSHCILQGFRKLPPAHALLYHLPTGDSKTWAYWTAPTLSASQAFTHEAEAAEALQQVLQKAVERQLVADVPVGILLSGGVDSSLVTALAAQSANTVHTYHVSFPGSAEDEAPFAAQIAAHFGTQHTVIPAEAASVQWLPALAAQYDEPMTDQSLVPTYMLCKVVKQHCTVALGGDGADEMFGGYNRYQRMLSLAAKAKLVPQPLRSVVGRMARQWLPLGFQGRHSLMEWSTNFTRQLPVIPTLFDAQVQQALLGSYARGHLAEQLAASETIPGTDVADSAMRTDLVRYMPEDILVKSDRAAMLASLEVRAPFLDADVVELALGRIPTSLKVSGASRKILLRELASRLLPAGYNSGRKQGFVPPLDKWLQSAEWLQFFQDHLLTGSDHWFAPSAVEALLKGQQKGQFNKRRLFALLMIELWRKQYHIQRG